MKWKEYLICFGIGAFAYGLIEVAVRGYTHWTMAITGGLVLIILNAVNKNNKLGLLAKCLIGMLVITSLEFTVGMIVNVGLGWNVWDYSEKPFNLYGQICPFFSIGWFFLSLPAYYICSQIEKRVSLR